MKKRVLITLTVIVGVLIIAGGIFKIRYDKMVRIFREERIETVYMQEINDGTYSGSYGDFLVSVTLEVTVSNNRITGIDVLEQNGGPGYEAEETLDRILEAQSPVVDVVSGATASSRCIMIAVYKALSDKN